MNMPRRNTVLKRQARKMVYDVNCFLKGETDELIYSLKQYVGSKNVKWSITKCTELIQEKVLLMGAWDWQKLRKKVKDIEEQYAKSDHVVDLVTEEFIIHVDGDTSENSIGEFDEDDAASADERSSPDSGPSKSKRPCRDTIEGVIPFSDSD